MYGRVALLLAPIVALSACGSKQPQQPRWVLDEFISVEDQARADVLAFPKEFVLAAGDLLPAEQRLELFLRDNAQGVGSQKLIEGEQLTRAQVGNWTFIIKRKLLSDGMRYTVECSSDGQSRETSDLNARNLARYIRDGWLEPRFLKIAKNPT